MSPRHSVAEAARTRERIVRAAVLDASRLGLEGLTVGTLARRLDMSKAGLVGPFGSRDRLLMAALDEAIEIFHAAVTAPLGDLPSGAERPDGSSTDGSTTWPTARSPAAASSQPPPASSTGAPGRCAAAAEIVAAHRRALAAEVAAAQAELPGPHRPAEEVATALFGLSMAANQEIQLLQDPTAPARARAAMRHAAGLDPQGRSHG